MTWLDELEKGDSSGDFEVTFQNGHRQSVPLKYPTGAAKVRVISLLSKVDRAKKQDAFTATEAAYKAIIDGCLDWPDRTNDKALHLLYVETGGPFSPLLARCVSLMGLSGFVSLPRADAPEEE